MGLLYPSLSSSLSNMFSSLIDISEILSAKFTEFDIGTPLSKVGSAPASFVIRFLLTQRLCENVTHLYLARA